MKRFITAVVFCSSLLVLCFYLVCPTQTAPEDLIKQLLDVPAPPPLNPLVDNSFRPRDPSFYDRRKPPLDSAPIEDLVDYWTQSPQRYGPLEWAPKVSGKALSRLLAEADTDPLLLPRLLESLPNDRSTADHVKRFYDQRLSEGDPANEHSPVRNWLRNNSSYFSGELERVASKIKDSDRYVNNQEELLNLSRFDFDRAKPILDQMYRDTSQPHSKVLATWALYRRALDTDSIDIDRYRDELKAIVADRKASDAMRDIANDALTHEREWPGRDEWFISLFEDETLVMMPSFTGLTTLIMYSPPDKYVPQMIELLERENIVVRTAAARNLITALTREQDPEKQKPIVKALLPWLEDPKWVKGNEETRRTLVNALQSIKIPESVDPLLAALDEKQLVDADDPSAYLYGSGAKLIANAANAIANSVRYAANTSASASANSNSKTNRPPPAKVTVYPLRRDAISALGNQGDQRAVPALRRVFSLLDEHEKSGVVRAIFQCNGFSIPEQVEAIETAARMPVPLMPAYASNVAANVAFSDDVDPRTREIIMAAAGMSYPGEKITFGTDLFKLMLATQLSALKDPSDQLMNAVVLRISELEKRDPPVAVGMRNFVTNWKGRAVNAFLLLNLKNGKTEQRAVIKLLAERVEIREQQTALIAEVGTGVPLAAGISACLLDSEANYVDLLEKGGNEAKAAMLACARLIRAKLPLRTVAGHLEGTDQRLALAAERYLESEDSPDAREIILARYPGKAKVMGATTAFRTNEAGGDDLHLYRELFASVHPFFLRGSALYGSYGTSFEADEKRLQKEVTENAELFAAYSYDDNFIRIFKNEAVFSWEDDPSRYRERKLEPEEFEALKELLIRHNAGDLTPFLACREYCEAKQLTMVGKNGGRRVYVSAERMPKFFAEFEALLKDFRSRPSKLRYWLEKDNPGLEILFADDSLSAETVWKNGDDLRILADKRATRAVSESDLMQSIEDAAESMAVDGEVDEEVNGEEVGESVIYQRRAESIAKHRFEGMSWLAVRQDGTTAPAIQPDGVEYILPIDHMDVLPSVGRWRSTAGDVEMRVGPRGLFKMVRGQLTKVSGDNHSLPVISANGRWILAYKFSEEGDGLVRHNLQTGRAYPLKLEQIDELLPIVFVPSVNRFLIGMPRYDHEYEEDDMGRSVHFTEGSFYFVDPETGAVSEAPGEMRPLAQQSFRPLQKTAKPNEAWAAIPDSAKNETRIGTYDTRTFAFKTVVTLPKITFDSMDMWVDGAARKAYFVYNGHLLSIPLDPVSPKS